jgi:hypothetical protein
MCLTIYNIKINDTKEMFLSLKNKSWTWVEDSSLQPSNQALLGAKIANLKKIRHQTQNLEQFQNADLSTMYSILPKI